MEMAQRAVVVDDDSDTRIVLRAVLEDEGYTVDEAADGVEALATLQASGAPAVVVLDLDLPGHDGLEIMRAVMGDARLAGRYAFVLLTALSYRRSNTAEQECAALGVPFLSKPFELDALLDAVREAPRRLSSP
jgi:CheY-like chemotaxis protein